MSNFSKAVVILASIIGLVAIAAMALKCDFHSTISKDRIEMHVYSNSRS